MNIIKALPLCLLLAGCDYSPPQPSKECKDARAAEVKWMQTNVTSHQMLRDEINEMVPDRCAWMTGRKFRKILLDLEKANTFPQESYIGNTK